MIRILKRHFPYLIIFQTSAASTVYSTLKNQQKILRKKLGENAFELFLDLHYVPHDPISGICSIFFKDQSFSICIFISASFLYLRLFSTSFFPIILWSNSDGPSCSDSLISLSYSMVVFSTKSFGLLDMYVKKFYICLF